MEKKKINIGVMDFKDEYASIIKSLRARLEYQNSAGIKDVCSMRAATRTGVETDPFEAVKARISACTLCPEREAGPVFGTGPACPVIMFITGAPSGEDIRKGRPISSEAGDQLSKIIGWMGTQLGIKDLGQKVFITNSIKCALRAGGADACREVLLEQIKALSPAIVIILGDEPSRYLLEGDVRALRGEVRVIGGVGAVVTHAPATLLERPELKRETMDDMLLAIREIKRAQAGN